MVERRPFNIDSLLAGLGSAVLRLLTEGCTNVQITEMLTVSPHTVKSYVISIFNKLGVSDRTQAAVLAIC